jgi:hypothetical protein
MCFARAGSIGFWNGRALVRGRQIFDPGTSWFWLVDMTQQVLRGIDIEEVPVFFRAWPTTDTSLPPILNRGIYAEAVAAAATCQGTTNLVDPEELRRVLQYPACYGSNHEEDAALGIGGSNWAARRRGGNSERPRRRRAQRAAASNSW